MQTHAAGRVNNAPRFISALPRFPRRAHAGFPHVAVNQFLGSTRRESCGDHRGLERTCRSQARARVRNPYEPSVKLGAARYKSNAACRLGNEFFVFRVFLGVKCCKGMREPELSGFSVSLSREMVGSGIKSSSKPTIAGARLPCLR